MSYSTSYQMTDAFIGFQAIGATDTTQNHPLGTVVRAKDPTYGWGEFIYLKGVASTVAGDVVTYDASFATTRAAAGTNLPRPVAFAMSANVASQYGWYQIGGLVIANKTKTVSLAAGVAVGVQSTALINATKSGMEVQGALVAVVGSATTTTKNGNQVQLMVNRPHLQGRVT